MSSRLTRLREVHAMILEERSGVVSLLAEIDRRLKDIQRAIDKPLPMAKGILASELAKGAEVKKSVAIKFLDTLTSVGKAEVKKLGVFTLPSFCTLKVYTKPAKKAGKKNIWGKVVKTKPKPARKFVKALTSKTMKALI